MLLRRVIPCLDVDKGRVVKGVEFVNLRDAGDPVELAVRYQDEGADEIVFLDITASHEKRETVGSARPPLRRRPVHTVHDRRRRALGRGRPGGARRGGRQGLGQLGRCGSPGAVGELAEVFGAQCVVLAIDARREARRLRYGVYVDGGRKAVGRDAVEWAREGVERGAGEILLTSMDRDGTEDGYELELTRRGRGRGRRAGDRQRRRGHARPPRGRGQRGRRRRGAVRLDLPLRAATACARPRSACARPGIPWCKGSDP